MKLVHQTNPKGLHRLRFKLRGEEIVSCQKDESLKNTQRTRLVRKSIVINHQNILGINMPLQSPPFWWIDDNTGFAQTGKDKGHKQTPNL